ncbi:MAG TPA: hypothetical protein VJB57_03035 [Dehalococcoidia bacterium]|nr:hypothetical protein [Dehalococcoidia bacterium]
MKVPANARVYRSGSFYWRQLFTRLCALGALAFGLGLLLGLALSFDALFEVGLSGLVLTLLFGFLILFFFLIGGWHHPRLVLSDAGIDIDEPDFRVATEWDNLAGLKAKGSLGLVTKEPLTGSGAERLVALGNKIDVDDYGQGEYRYDEEARNLIAEGRFVPLTAFDHWLLKGNLGREFIRRAPLLEPGVEAAMAGPTSGGLLLGWLFVDDKGQQLPRKNLVQMLGALVLAFILVVASEAGPDAVRSRAGLLLAVVFSLCLAGYGIISFIKATQLLDDRKYRDALIWGGLAIVNLLLGMAAIGAVLPE